MTTGRILIVDDSPGQLELARRHVERRGHESYLAPDGPTALQILAHEPVDLVLLDIVMPGMDGMETLRRIRRRHGSMTLPVIMVTGKEDSGEIIEALRSGADDYVTKPVDFGIALARIEGQLERKQSNGKLLDALAAARSASNAKTEFVATMGHELRTPLNAIIGFADLIATTAGSGDGKRHVEWAANIRAAGEHLLAVVNNVIDVATASSGHMVAHLEPVEIAAACRAALAIVRPLADRNNNTLELVLDDGIGMVETDGLKLRQCLINLLGNACKFTQQGQVVLRVTRRRRAAGEFLAFAVADNGIGIAEMNIAKLFKLFSQVDAAISGRYGGSGLGLALSAELARILGGDITVHSKLGHGSTFTLLLPMRAPTAAEQVAAHA